MDFFTILKQRQCCRVFDSKKEVSEQDLSIILKNAGTAPSAGNIQDWRFKVVRQPTIKRQIARACLNQSFIADASLIVVICSDLAVISSRYGERGRDLYAIQDTAACAQNMFLTVTALGLAACWVGAFREKALSRLLELPYSWRPLVVMPIGYSL